MGHLHLTLKDDVWMPRKPLDLPPEVAREFVKATKAYFKETDPDKKREIVATQRFILNEYLPAKERLRLDQVIEMFIEMRKELK